MKKIGAFEAKTQLSRLLRDVEELDEEIIILRREKPVAVLISYKEYESRKEKGKKRNIVQELRNLRSRQTPNTPVSIEELNEMIREGRKY